MERMMISTFKATPAPKLDELLVEPKLIISDGEEKYVAMSLEAYAKMRPFKANGQMCRIQGKMFREVE